MAPTLLATSFWDYFFHPAALPRANDLHTWCQDMDPLSAALLIIGGLVFLLSGFKMHRLLLATTGAVLGACLGGGLGQRYGLLWAGLAVGLLLLGVAAWYITAGAAAVLGAIVGAFAGAAVWYMSKLDPVYAWSGALTGAVALGLLSFILFRISVILFTSMQGALMLVLGILGMGYHYPAIRPMVDNSLNSWPYFLPVTVLTLMLTGLAYQHMKGPGGGAGGKSGGAAAGKAAPAKAEKS
jgi:hypothetical protein